MGNVGSLPDDVKDRFATCELETIEERFQQLSKEGSFRGKTFDLGTFKRYYLKSYPEIADLIFFAFDVDGNKKISLEEFACGISHCTRGTKKEKYMFIFSMFDKNRDKKISKKEYESAIHSSFFAENGNESSKERKERIKKSVDDAFSKYDKDNNGCLTIKEFLEWAETSPEVQRLFKLFSKMDNDLTKSSESGAVSMINVTHDTHVGVSKSGSLMVDNLPPSWVSLFKEAGATEKELEDPEIVVMLMGIVAERISSGKQLSSGDLSETLSELSMGSDSELSASESATSLTDISKEAMSESTSSLTDAKQPISESTSSLASRELVSESASSLTDAKQPISESVSSLASTEPISESTSSLADAKQPQSPSISEKSSDDKKGDNIPPPPEGMAPPVPQPKETSTDLLSEIKTGTKLKHAKPIKHKPKTSDFLAEIKKGKNLHHVDKGELEAMNKKDRNDLTSVLSRAIQQHRDNLRVDERDDNSDENEAEWDD